MTLATETGFLIATAVCLAALAIVDIRRSLVGSPTLFIAGTALATALSGAAVAGRWIREGQGPFLTLYDVLLSNVFSLTLIFLLAAIRAPVFRGAASPVFGFIGMLAVWALSTSPNALPLPATFDNPWLWVHVLTGKLFLGGLMLAAAAAGVSLAKRRSGAAGVPLAAAVWPALAVAFVFHSAMLVAGAVWAYSAWGRYWAWDPLETWTFVTWLAIALLLHARVSWRQMPPAAGQLSVLVLFALAVATFLGVPFLSLAPHKGVL